MVTFLNHMRCIAVTWHTHKQTQALGLNPCHQISWVCVCQHSCLCWRRRWGREQKLDTLPANFLVVRKWKWSCSAATSWPHSSSSANTVNVPEQEENLKHTTRPYLTMMMTPTLWHNHHFHIHILFCLCFIMKYNTTWCYSLSSWKYSLQSQLSINVSFVQNPLKLVFFPCSDHRGIYQWDVDKALQWSHPFKLPHSYLVHLCLCLLCWWHLWLFLGWTLCQQLRKVRWKQIHCCTQ